MDQRKATLALASLFISGSAVFFSPAAFAEPAAAPGKVIQSGRASWYGPGFHGKSTANGERYDQSDRTAAHRTLQMPAVVRVTNLDNGQSTIVRVNDRGPFARNRVIDLSRTAAQEIDMIGRGEIPDGSCVAMNSGWDRRAKARSTATRTQPA